MTKPQPSLFDSIDVVVLLITFHVSNHNINIYIHIYVLIEYKDKSQKKTQSPAQQSPGS